MSKLIPIAWLALLGSAGGPAHAQDLAQPGVPARGTMQQQDPASSAEPGSAAQGNKAAARPAAAADTKIQEVNVTAARANDTEQRRQSTAGKMVFGREELDRNGDTSIGEVLKRLPGVSVGGAPGRAGGGIRMRGLGSGYTQMLINGERAPRGFSLESLAPEQVERIEVMRGPVAEYSTQAIAGTINIVLREGYQQKDIQLRAADSIEQGRHGPNLSLTVPGKSGNLTWLLTGSVMQRRSHDESDTRTIDSGAASGALEREQLARDTGDGRSRGIHLSPRLSYKFENGDTLTFQPFLAYNRSDSSADSTIDQTIGALPPAYGFQHSSSSSSSTLVRGFGNWVHRIGGGARLDVKFGGSVNRSASDSLRNTFNPDGSAERAYVDTDSTRERSFNAGGKFTSPLGQGHLLAAGWDIETAHRDQEHVALDNGGALFDDSGATLSADTRRVALFMQDEWDITAQWSAYLGLRWEGIRTTSAGSGPGASNTSSVWSPVLHTVWRIPGRDKDQVRASLTQSYRAPGLNDLIAAPSFSTDNRQTRPDRTGNPDLKPELAKGLDLTYEHYLGRSGIVSASGFVRNIDNLMRRVTTQQMTANGLRYVSTPINIGKARTSGVELEAKFQLAELVADAPNIDLRSNYSRYWSNVDGIPGPNNRLDQQARQSANLGADYRMKALPLTMGGSWNWTPSVLVQTSATESTYTGLKRQIDLYGLWKFNPGTQLRVSVNNLNPNLYNTGRSVTGDALSQAAGAPVTESSNTATRTYATVSVRLEMKL